MESQLDGAVISEALQSPDFEGLGQGDRAGTHNFLEQGRAWRRKESQILDRAHLAELRPEFRLDEQVDCDAIGLCET